MTIRQAALTAVIATVMCAASLIGAAQVADFKPVTEASGKILFQMRLPHPVQGFPVTYAVRGRQYLALPTSSGSLSSQESTGAGNPIFVFALPERAIRPAR